MTVNDLIEQLEGLDAPDAEVILDLFPDAYIWRPVIERGGNRNILGYPSRDGDDYDPTIVRLTND